MYYFARMELIIKGKIFRSLLIPFCYVLLLWIIKAAEITLETDYIDLGVYPLSKKGLLGIITAPLIHGNIEHLWSNSGPIMVLGACVFYFYPRIAFKVSIGVYLLSGAWLWLAGRSAYHIGSSGLVYGFASFIFFSGMLRKNRNLLAISLLVSFLYGGLLWGILPQSNNVSFESHILGGIAGLVMAFHYRENRSSIEKESPPKNNREFYNVDTTLETTIKYHFKENWENREEKETPKFPDEPNERTTC